MSDITTQPSAGFSRHSRALAAIAAVLVLLAFIWMVTRGTLDLFQDEILGKYYDAQGQSLCAGRWDVPRSAIDLEQYEHDGKFYGYYGFVPALPRIALDRLFPGMSGLWCRASMTLACAVTLFYCYRLLLLRLGPLARQPGIPPGSIAPAGFVMLAGLGSSTIFLGSTAFLYHEAIIWAVALALACYDHLLAYLTEGRWTQLALACGLAFLSFFCRISTGSGPCLAIFLAGCNILAWNVSDRARLLAPLRWARRLNGWLSPPPLAHAATAALALLAIISSYVAINRAKFGTFFEAAPMQYYSQMVNDPVRWEKSGGKWMRLGNVPTTAFAYFSPTSVSFTKKMPFVSLRTTLREFPGQHMAGNGPFSSLTVAMPLLLVLALAGVVSAACRHRARGGTTAPARASPLLVLIGSVGSVVPVLMMFTVEARYLHEFFPFLVLGSALAIHSAAGLRRRRLKSAIAVAMIVVGAYQIYVNWSFALVYQRWLYGA